MPSLAIFRSISVELGFKPKYLQILSLPDNDYVKQNIFLKLPGV